MLCACGSLLVQLYLVFMQLTRGTLLLEHVCVLLIALYALTRKLDSLIVKYLHLAITVILFLHGIYV